MCSCESSNPLPPTLSSTSSGTMPAVRDLLAATAEHGSSVFTEFKNHANGTRTDTRSTVLRLLRESYPEYHVTESNRSSIALFEFAQAEKATVVHDHTDESFNATRSWRPVGERIEKKLHPGKLADDFRFARFQYIWEAREFLVYYVSWQDPFKGPEQIFYILYQRVENGANIVDGHCLETDELCLAAGKWTSLLHKEIWVFDDGHWEKSQELFKSVNGSSWDDVILDQEMKKNLIEDVQGFFDNQKLYSQFAVPWKRGIILHGVPGNGKTVSIKALMSSLYDREDEIPSLYVKSLENKCQTELYSIRQIFLQARNSSPCLLIFEDLDSLVTDEIRSYFLNEVDGLESNDGILMIGSTNHLDKLDPAIAKRPSRFDRKYHFKLPGEQERRMYAEYWRTKLLANETVEFPLELCSYIAKLTEGFSFAYLKELFVMALLSLVRGFKGEDFEIVDAEEGKKTPTPPPESSTIEPSNSISAITDPNSTTCTCSKTCSTCHKPLPADETKKSEDEATATKVEATINKVVISSVEIPDDLADNVLLKVLKHQIRILHDEMDNTKEEQWPSGKKGLGGAGGGKRGRVAMARAMRAGIF